MVESAAQAQHIVAATRYPPARHPWRGQCARPGLALEPDWRLPARLRALNCVYWSRWNPSRGLKNLPDIAATEGVDGVFFGPADLAASLGVLGRPADQQVQDAITQGIKAVRHAGKAAGVLSADPLLARRATWTQVRLCGRRCGHHFADSSGRAVAQGVQAGSHASAASRRRPTETRLAPLARPARSSHNKVNSGPI